MRDAFNDQPHPSDIDQRRVDLMGQSVFQIAGGYEETNDANIHLAKTLGSRWEWRFPLEEDPDLARVATFSDREKRPHHETSIVWLRFW